MIQIAIVTTTPHSARHTRKLQREMALVAKADALFRAKLGADSSVSISHCRGISGASVTDEKKIGLDIEYAAADRDWHGILSVFHKQLPHLTASESARIWTFIEAWYKAFSAWPSHTQIDEFRLAGTGPVCIEAQAHAWAVSLSADFELCVVWSGARQTPDLVSSDFSQTA